MSISSALISSTVGDAYEKNKFAFLFSIEDWYQNRVSTIEFAILGHALFRRKVEGLTLDCYNRKSKLSNVTLS